VFPGVIASTMFVGHYTDFRIRVGGQVTLRVFTRPSRSLSLGQSLILRIAPEACTVLPAPGAIEETAAERSGKIPE